MTNRQTAAGAAGWMLARLFGAALLVVLAAGMIPPLIAADEAKKAFNIPPGEASATLKQFTAQAGEQLLYTMDMVKGVASHAIKGEMSPRQALEGMFAGTSLAVVQDSSNGALSLVRAPDSNAPRAVAANANSRSSSARAKTADAAGETVTLSPFNVSEDQDSGYVATNSLAGSRLNTALKDTAASVSVLTKEFLDDIGATSIADAMAWSTNSQLTQGDTLVLANSGDDVNATFFNFDNFRVRGLPATQTKNYFEWTLPTDTYNSDRVEEARGPNSILFGIGSAGGVINAASKRAITGRTLRSATIGISSHGGYRGTIDLNEPFGRRLALRFNGVYDRTESFRNFNFGQKQMAALAATFRFRPATTLRAEYETGRIRENVGTNQQATDQFSSWIAGGGRLIAAPIAATQNAEFGVNRFAATTRVTYIGNSNSVLNLANQYTTLGNDNVFAPSVVPYEVSVGGPGVLRRPHFDTLTLSLEHRLGRSTFIELAYNHQQYQTFNQQVTSGFRLYMDPNATLPGGQPNPHAGQYYVESESWAWDYGRRDDNSRVSFAHELDVGRWGRYRFAALGEYQWRSPRTTQLFEVWADHPYGATFENQANVVVRRQYVAMGDWGHFYYKNPMAFGLIQDLRDPVTDRTLSSTWVPRNAANVRDNPEYQKSLLLATQARYFGDRLVLGVGFRADKLDTITRGSTRDANGLFVSDYANNTFASYDGRTSTLGAVYHVTPKISFFYNHSDNFGLPPNILLVPDGRRAGNPEGRGTDYGIAVTLFDGKLYARANYYKTDLVNGSNSNYGGTVTAPDAVGDTILNALVAQGQISSAEADRHRVTNTGATFAQLVEGYEFNLTANPTRNWRLQANFSYTDGYTSEVAPEVQAWAATEIPFFRRFDQDLNTAGGTIRQVLANWEEYNRGQLELVGLTLPGNRRCKVNLYTSYSFDRGALRGFRIGGGYRHQSRIPIGQYADKSLQYGPSWWDSSAMMGYRFSTTPWPWLRRVGLQLNVNNLFDEDDAYVLRRVQGTNPEVVRRVRVREPRTWRLTASFDL